jgi:hypothetical protein
MENRDQLLSIRTLARQIREGKCVLVLGPGASTDPSGPEEVPLHIMLARQLAATLRIPKEEKKDLNTDDLRHVSQILLDRQIRNPFVLQDMVVEFYKQFSGNTTSFHRNIASLPFELCITTTPDDFMFNALQEAGKSPTRDFYNFRESHSVNITEPTPKYPLVYHLYGYLDEPGSLVVTENDLIDFLVKIVQDAPPLPKGITARLSRTVSTCLFVDLGFKNWYLRVLMRSLGLRPDQVRAKSVALEDREFFVQPKQHQTTVFFSGSTPIDFHQESLDEFASGLREQYDLLDRASRPPASVPAAGAPMAFLSYASEDREFVERLADQLQVAGIAVWQDKQKLRAGDDWERKLTYVIENLVNYVVVVQTISMLQQPEGYFYQEIRAALRRQERIREGLRFVVPVRTCDNNLQALDHLHSICVKTHDGIGELVRSIHEDWNARALTERLTAVSVS